LLLEVVDLGFEFQEVPRKLGRDAETLRHSLHGGFAAFSLGLGYVLSLPGYVLEIHDALLWVSPL
jgi:hypothetical protein